MKTAETFKVLMAECPECGEINEIDESQLDKPTQCLFCDEHFVPLEG
jgi:phage FluMu protein Com